MNIYKQLEQRVKDIATALQQSGVLPADVPIARIEAQPPKETGHGDIATNAAMVLAAAAKKNPREIANVLLPEILKLAEVASAEIAGPGFINMTLKAEVWQSVIPVILKEGIGFGNSTIGAKQKVNVEYVSANPTGPMHVGHARYIYGDALATLLLKAGYDVTKEYYINDAGGQIDKLADSAFLRYREALGEAIGDIPEGLYPGDYLKGAGEGLAQQYGKELLEKPRDEWLPIVRQFTVDCMIALIKEDLALLGIQFDVFTSERSIVERGLVDAAIQKLEKDGLVYVGVLEPPKGKPIPEDWEPRPQTLFKSTQFGDDLDRALKKSDGSWTYFAPDLAYHLDKIERGYTRLINLFGADHGGYVKRIIAAVTALSGGKATLEVKLCQLVKFMRGGEPLKMSKRAGTFVTVREVVEEVGRGVFRFIMLTRRNDQPLDFDFEKVMEQSKDNPVFYVQYAHARAKSVLRNAAADMPEAVERAKNVDAELLNKLSSPDELSLIKLMSSWPRVVESAAIAAEPHRVAFFVQELAAEFHSLWNQGNNDNQLRFLIKHDINLTAARIALAQALATVVASGLMVLGVEPLEELR